MQTQALKGQVSDTAAVFGTLLPPDTLLFRAVPDSSHLSPSTGGWSAKGRGTHATHLLAVLAA